MSITLSMQTPVMLCELLPIAPIAIVGQLKNRKYLHMKIFIYILMAFAIVVVAYNLTLLNFDALLVGDSSVALIGILAAGCVIVLLSILLTSKAIERKAKL